MLLSGCAANVESVLKALAAITSATEMVRMHFFFFDPAYFKPPIKAYRFMKNDSLSIVVWKPNSAAAEEQSGAAGICL
jgi:hypothetical protein